MERIDIIELDNLLPRVFSGEEIPHSRVWKCGCRFERTRGGRPCAYMVEARSGGGKSSLISFLYGAREDYEGRVMFNGRDAAGFSVDQWQLLRRNHLGWLPQDLMLFGELTALENVLLKNGLTGFKTEIEIKRMLGELGLEERMHWPVRKLSVGQQQRVAIVRALCQPMDFLLIDEPVSHLDETNNRTAARMVAGEACRQGAGIIATSVGNPLMLEYDVKLEL